MNYGNDLLLISTITSYIELPEFFNDVPAAAKTNLPEIAFKATLILLTGSISDSIYINNGIDEDYSQVELSAPYLRRTQNIDHLLSSISKNHPHDFIQENIQNILLTFSIPEIWNSIFVLTKSIFNKEGIKLTWQEIEVVLTSTDYFNHTKKYM